MDLWQILSGSWFSTLTLQASISQALILHLRSTLPLHLSDLKLALTLYFQTFRLQPLNISNLWLFHTERERESETQRAEKKEGENGRGNCIFIFCFQFLNLGF